MHDRQSVARYSIVLFVILLSTRFVGYAQSSPDQTVPGTLTVGTAANSPGTLGPENQWFALQIPIMSGGAAQGILLDPTSGNWGDIVFLQNQGFPFRIVDADSKPFSFQETEDGATLTSFNNAPPWVVPDNNIFCVSTTEDYTGVGGPNACDAFDIFDVSNRETFGDGYMHWYANGVGQAFNGAGYPLAPNPGWNAGISNPAVGVLSFDTTSDGNGLATIKVAKIVYPDGTTTSSATSTSVGTVTSGVWNGTPILAAYLPSDVDYIDQAQTISGRKSFTSSVGIGTSSPQASLEVDGSTILGGAQPSMPPGQTLVTGNAPNASLAGLVLYNAGGGGGSAVSIDLYNTQQNANIPQARIQGIDNGDYSDNLLFLTKNPGGPSNGLVEHLRITSSGNVGIGTSSPGATLEVNGNVKLSSGSGASVTFPDGTVQATAWNGTTFGGDYAESIDVLGDRASYQAGDVIVIDENTNGKFLKSTEAYSRMVAGVYSTKPGLVGRRTTADRPDKDAELPMAMMGIVPTKVSTENGPIARGDLLVSSSTPGYAMKGTDRDRMMGAIIGKALAPLSSGIGVIEVLISLQ